jgi:hypothetical protein
MNDSAETSGILRRSCSSAPSSRRYGYDTAMLGRLRRYLRRKKYVTGAQLTQFLAPDVRRDVEIVDASEVDAGFVCARIRTWNVLHALHGMSSRPEFGAPRRMAIAELWRWTGERWGGPIPADDVGRPDDTRDRDR